MRDDKLRIDHLIDIVRKGGTVKTGVEQATSIIERRRGTTVSLGDIKINFPEPEHGEPVGDHPGG